MKLPFGSNGPTKLLRQPVPSPVPELPSAQLAAKYRAARVGGDFFDFLVVNGSKLIFILLDIAGKRDNALHIAAEAQDCFRQRGVELYSTPNIEDSQATITLLLEMNRIIIKASGGVCCAPAFLGCYDMEASSLTYINAGHIPGILKDDEGTLLLEANGLPLGLFSHSTHDSQYCALRPGAAVVLVSKGLVEIKTDGKEFGMQRVQAILGNGTFESAEAICDAILKAVKDFEKAPSRFGPSLSFAGLGSHEPNDVTTLALMRDAAAAAAGS